MSLDVHTAELAELERVALEEAIVAIRDEAEVAALVEHRTASLHALLAQHDARYLPLATSELEDALGELRAVGDRRLALVGGLVPVLGLSFQPTIGEVVAAAPEPYATTIAELRRRLLVAKSRIEWLSEQNTNLLGERMALVSEALSDGVTEAVPTYGRTPPSLPRFVRGIL
ncbi:MAG TPA: hypothetical protein VMU75_12940 [Acidimicrobiales bacterium]|nr:hypothetical protein [Acidimicrobiales bacterium]